MGDMVEKSGGAIDLGNSGIVISKATNSLGNTLVTVLTPTGMCIWYLPLVTKKSSVQSN